jgi:hypothetical protein
MSSVSGEEAFCSPQLIPRTHEHHSNAPEAPGKSIRSVSSIKITTLSRRSEEIWKRGWMDVFLSGEGILDGGSVQ